MDITKFDWNKIESLTDSIASDIESSGWKPSYIVGIVRGGLVPAVLLSHKLRVKMHTLGVSLRDGEDTDSESNLWMPEDVVNGTNILIVDDINDSGNTLDWIRTDWYISVAGCKPPCDMWWHDRVRIATVVNNLGSKETVDYCGVNVDKRIDPRWIVFPWESK
jgi:hypoxanthine-guanine phosphoribosyltransferase